MICIADVKGVRCDKDAVFGSNYCGLHNRFVLTDTERFGGLQDTADRAFSRQSCDREPDDLDITLDLERSKDDDGR